MKQENFARRNEYFTGRYVRLYDFHRVNHSMASIVLMATLRRNLLICKLDAKWIIDRDSEGDHSWCVSRHKTFERTKRNESFSFSFETHDLRSISRCNDINDYLEGKEFSHLERQSCFNVYLLFPFNRFVLKDRYKKHA